MVVDGVVLRELLLAGSTATELLGPGDIVDHAAPGETLLPTEARWSAPEAARVVILDDRLSAILRTWPGVGRILLRRAARREIRLSTHRAIAQLPRVDQRLLAFFGHLAERWGAGGVRRG
jgi:CRP/FNR family cyclic AMP-dependent transcriptional regulator